MKPRVFIASSTEKLPLATAVARHLKGHAQVRLWSRGVFKLSHYILESLEAAAGDSDAGVFILAPDDLLTTRRRKGPAVRDNVLFELGLFIGALGRQRALLVAPRGGSVHLPSDILGLTPALYRVPHGKVRWSEVMRLPCADIKTTLRDLAQNRVRSRLGLHVKELDFFRELSARVCPDLFATARHLTTFFIHSRSWRDTNVHHLRAFLARKATTMTVIMPWPGDTVLEQVFRRNFDDGPKIPGFVRDACAFYAGLCSEFPGKVTVRFSRYYPTYSFYAFDRMILAAMYPTTARKKSVPAFLAPIDSELGAFVKDDIQRLLAASREASRRLLVTLGR